MKDIFEMYTTRHIRKITCKNFYNIIMYGKGQKGLKKLFFYPQPGQMGGTNSFVVTIQER